MKTLICLLFILALSCFATAQSGKTNRVRFQRGRTTAVVRGKITGSEIKRYRFHAREGQSAAINLAADYVQFDLYPEGDRRGMSGGEDVKDWSGKLPRTGYYIISVYAMIKGSLRYTLEITIR